MEAESKMKRERGKGRIRQGEREIINSEDENMIDRRRERR